MPSNRAEYYMPIPEKFQGYPVVASVRLTLDRCVVIIDRTPDSLDFPAGTVIPERFGVVRVRYEGTVPFPDGYFLADAKWQVAFDRMLGLVGEHGGFNFTQKQ